MNISDLLHSAGSGSDDTGKPAGKRANTAEADDTNPGTDTDTKTGKPTVKELFGLNAISKHIDVKQQVMLSFEERYLLEQIAKIEGVSMEAVMRVGLWDLFYTRYRTIDLAGMSAGKDTDKEQ